MNQFHTSQNFTINQTFDSFPVNKTDYNPEKDVIPSEQISEIKPFDLQEFRIKLIQQLVKSGEELPQSQRPKKSEIADLSIDPLVFLESQLEEKKTSSAIVESAESKQEKIKNPDLPIACFNDLTEHYSSFVMTPEQARDDYELMLEIYSDQTQHPFVRLQASAVITFLTLRLQDYKKNYSKVKTSYETDPLLPEHKSKGEEILRLLKMFSLIQTQKLGDQIFAEFKLHLEKKPVKNESLKPLITKAVHKEQEAVPRSYDLTCVIDMREKLARSYDLHQLSGIDFSTDNKTETVEAITGTLPHESKEEPFLVKIRENILGKSNS
jgi:hypothetical protein